MAVADWFAVARDRRRGEALLKPLVPALLALGALAAHRWWFVAALAGCLAGDVLLLPQVDRFRSGLVAFLLAHVAFIGGFLAYGKHGPATAPVLLVILAAAYPASRVLSRAPSKLKVPIGLYAAVLFGLVAAASAGSPMAFLGAVLFLVSDGLLGWNRFVGQLPTGRLGVMISYHLAIGLLTLSVAL